MNIIHQATKIIGLKKLADACGVSSKAVQKWRQKGSLPRTEWTGETNYSEVIERLSKGVITKEQLLRSLPPAKKIL